MSERAATVRWTGEIIDLRGMTTVSVATFAVQLRDLELRVKEAKAVAERELIYRMDEDRCWTIHTDDGVTLSAPSPSRTEMDAKELMAVLEELVADGDLPEDVAKRAVRTTITHKPDRRGVNAIIAGGGVAAQRVGACARAVVRHVTVTR